MFELLSRNYLFVFLSKSFPLCILCISSFKNFNFFKGGVQIYFTHQLFDEMCKRIVSCFNVDFYVVFSVMDEVTFNVYTVGIE